MPDESHRVNPVNHMVVVTCLRSFPVLMWQNNPLALVIWLGHVTAAGSTGRFQFPLHIINAIKPALWFDDGMKRHPETSLRLPACLVFGFGALILPLTIIGKGL